MKLFWKTAILVTVGVVPVACAQHEPAAAGLASTAPMDAEEDVAETVMADQPSIPEAPAQRQVIYNANLTGWTLDMGQVTSQVEQVVRDGGGYILTHEVGIQSYDYRVRKTQTWTVKVPVAAFSETVQRLATLIDVEERRITSRDVTEEFIDVKARLKSTRAMEDRLQVLLKEKADDLEDILRVEAELGRVRNEIERMQGRLKYLQAKSDMSEISLTIHERHQEVAMVIPGLGEKMQKTFGKSWESVVSTMEWLLLIAVSLVPWLPVLAIFIGLVVYLPRRLGFVKAEPST